MGPAAAGHMVERRAPRGDRRPRRGRSRARARGRPRAPARSRSRSRRRGRGARARDGARARPRASTGSPLATRSASRPAMPCSRTSRSSRSPPAGPWRPSRSRASSRRTPCMNGGSPSSSIGGCGARWAWRRISRGSVVPFQWLRSRRTTAPTGSPGSAGSLRARAEQHAARAGAARGEREGDVAALPHRPRVVEQRGRDEQRDGGVALAERGQLLELLGERERERVARRDGVDAHLRPQVLGCERRSRRGRRTPRGRPGTSARGIVRPAAARWPP